MAYSSGALSSTPNGPDNSIISVRLAASSDNGENWQDQGIVLFAGNETPLPPPSNSGIWQYEVANLAYDQDAPTNEKWKIFSFRYLMTGGNRLNDHSWIALKTSATPAGNWSAERKLFVGAIYNTPDDAIVGPPEVRLNQIQDGSGGTPLSDCATFTEPGAISKPGALYVALGCATGVGKDRIVLLKLTHPSETWSYIGVLLANSEAPSGYFGFSAPELVNVRGTDYLIVSPADQTAYHGCLVYKVSALSTAQIYRQNGVLSVQATIPDTGLGNNGACSYDPLATESGILYLQQYPMNPPPIQIYKTFLNL